MSTHIRRQCEYRDPVTGQRCRNTAQSGEKFCRPCARKVSKGMKLIQVVDQALYSGELSDKASVLMPPPVQDECLAFLRTLRQRFSICQVILYGSYAKKRAHRWSDIDMAVISSDFRKLSFLRRTIVLRRTAVEANTPRIQAIGFTLRQFESDRGPRIIKKVRQGVPLFHT